MCIAHVCAALTCHQWQWQSGRALGPPGPGRHCSTVMSPLPVRGWEGVGEFGRAGKTQISKTVWQRAKKEQADDRWCESPIKAPTADSTLRHRYRLLTGPTNKINEPGGSNKIQLVSTTDSLQSLYPRFKTSTKASINNCTEKWKAKCWNPNPAYLSNTCLCQRGIRVITLLVLSTV